MKRGLVTAGLIALCMTAAGVSLFLPDEFKVYPLLIFVVAAASIAGLKGGLTGAAAASVFLLIYNTIHPVIPLGKIPAYAAVFFLCAVPGGFHFAFFIKERSRFLTEANRIEEEKVMLAESESKYRSIYENTPDGISYQKVIFDKYGKPKDYVFIEANESFERQTGLDRKLMANQTVKTLLNGRFDPFFDWIKHYEKAAQTGREVRFQSTYSTGSRSFIVTIYVPTFGYFYTILHDVTDIKEKDEDFKSIVESNKDVISRFDRNLNCLYTNYSDDYKNKRPMEIIFGKLDAGSRIPQDVQQQWQQKVLQVFLSRREETIQIKVNTPYGNKYYECRLVPEFSHDGYVESVICINHDDTAYRSAEADMMRTLSKLKELENIINSSPVIAFLWHADDRWSAEYISTNIDQFGYKQDDFSKGKKSFIDLINSDDIIRLKEEIDSFIKNGINEFSLEFFIRTKAGEERQVRMDAWVRRNAVGQVTHYQGTLIDVTNIIKLPRHLIESQQQVKGVLEGIKDISFILDNNGTFLNINNEGEAYFGFSKDELRKLNILQLVPNESASAAKAMLTDLISGPEKEKEYRLEMINRDYQIDTLRLSCRQVLESGRLSISVTARIMKDNDPAYNPSAMEQVKYLSYHDKLTGLYNRTYFEDELVRLEQELELPLSIIIGDVDGLKLTNDAFGHKQGDQLLKKMADILKSCCTDKDAVIRLGGDEFAVILRQTDEVRTANICSQVKEMCSLSEEEPVKLSIALGAATLYDKSMSIEELVKQAEDRMNRSKLMETRSIRSSIISSLQKTLEERTYETKKHAERMQKLAEKLGKALGLSESEMDELNLLCVLHDIGKIGIPDQILMKSGRLSMDEWEIMKKHTEIGYNIAISTPDLKPIAEGILAHHENWDGTGYPNHLQGEQIPLIARIIAVIDAYDAMINDRPYHKAISQIAAIIEIDRCAGTQFDPRIVEAFKKELLS